MTTAIKVCTMNCCLPSPDPLGRTKETMVRDCEDCEVRELPGRPLQIWRSLGGISSVRTVEVGPCPYCTRMDALCVDEVELLPHDSRAPQRAVHCGDCGARGPWSATEEGAVKYWNRSTGTRDYAYGDWELLPPASPAPGADSEYGF